MKLYPATGNRSVAVGSEASMVDQANGCRKNKLLRLPFIFEKVLELPFHADTEVWIEETPESIIFTVDTFDMAGDVKADTVQTFPGVSKIVIRGEGIVEPAVSEFELDLWRIRLPGRTMPDLACASYGDGKLVVTVPKGVVERSAGREVELLPCVKR